MRARAAPGLLLLLLGLGLLPSCSLFTTLWREVPARPRGLRSPAGYVDYKGVVHCHSFRSHDSDGSVEEIAAAARDTAMDFVVMTDHPSPYSVTRGARGMIGGVLFLCGAEVRVRDGTILAFPLQRPLRPLLSLPAMLSQIRRQGGLAFVGHAERFRDWSRLHQVAGLHGIELHNLHAATKAAPPAELLGRGIFTPMSQAFEVLMRPDPAVLQNVDALSQRRHPLAMVGGNDAHANIRLLGPLGWVIADYDEVFRLLSTHVLAETLDEASLVEALRAGRSYLSLDHWGEATGFAFWAETPTGPVSMGATVGSEAVLKVRSPRPASLRLLRDGEVLQAQDGLELRFAGPGPGVYRVEVWLDGRPWIFSSSIKVRAAAGKGSAGS